jgi:hypothetical protein
MANNNQNVNVNLEVATYLDHFALFHAPFLLTAFKLQ